jgi:hypothetical protein
VRAEFTREVLRKIDNASSQIKLEDARYPERLEQLTREALFAIQGIAFGVVVAN